MASADLLPGTVIRYKSGKQYVLARRKDADDPRPSGMPYHPGWWLEDGGGIADFVLDGSDEWTVVGRDDA